MKKLPVLFPLICTHLAVHSGVNATDKIDAALQARLKLQQDMYNSHAQNHQDFQNSLTASLTTLGEDTDRAEENALKESLLFSGYATQNRSIPGSAPSQQEEVLNPDYQKGLWESWNGMRQSFNLGSAASKVNPTPQSTENGPADEDAELQTALLASMTEGVKSPVLDLKLGETQSQGSQTAASTSGILKESRVSSSDDSTTPPQATPMVSTEVNKALQETGSGTPNVPLSPENMVKTAASLSTEISSPIVNLTIPPATEPNPSSPLPAPSAPTKETSPGYVAFQEKLKELNSPKPTESASAPGKAQGSTVPLGGSNDSPPAPVVDVNSPSLLPAPSVPTKDTSPSYVAFQEKLKELNSPKPTESASAPGKAQGSTVPLGGSNDSPPAPVVDVNSPSLLPAPSVPTKDTSPSYVAFQEKLKELNSAKPAESEPISGEAQGIAIPSGNSNDNPTPVVDVNSPSPLPVTPPAFTKDMSPEYVAFQAKLNDLKSANPKESTSVLGEVQGAIAPVGGSVNNSGANPVSQQVFPKENAVLPSPVLNELLPVDVLQSPFVSSSQNSPGVTTASSSSPTASVISMGGKLVTWPVKEEPKPDASKQKGASVDYLDFQQKYNTLVSAEPTASPSIHEETQAKPATADDSAVTLPSPAKKGEENVIQPEQPVTLVSSNSTEPHLGGVLTPGTPPQGVTSAIVSPNSNQGIPETNVMQASSTTPKLPTIKISENTAATPPSPSPRKWEEITPAELLANTHLKEVYNLYVTSTMDKYGLPEKGAQTVAKEIMKVKIDYF